MDSWWQSKELLVEFRTGTADKKSVKLLRAFEKVEIMMHKLLCADLCPKMGEMKLSLHGTDLD